MTFSANPISLPFELIPIYTRDNLETIKNLYTTSFSPHERREFEELEVQIKKKECQMFKIVTGDILLGLISIWNFNDFIFLEHFAISPLWRGKGLGHRVINHIMLSKPKPFILEVEPPTDEISAKRIKFYTQLGFTLLSRVYIQPSYDEAKPHVELRLMTSAPAIAKNNLDVWIGIIHKRVYRG